MPDNGFMRLAGQLLRAVFPEPRLPEGESNNPWEICATNSYFFEYTADSSEKHKLRECAWIDPGRQIGTYDVYRLNHFPINSDNGKIMFNPGEETMRLVGIGISFEEARSRLADLEAYYEGISQKGVRGFAFVGKEPPRRHFSTTDIRKIKVVKKFVNRL